jgi:hypothetical protein
LRTANDREFARPFDGVVRSRTDDREVRLWRTVTRSSRADDRGRLDPKDHVAEPAELWNVDVGRIPHYGPPAHLMQILRYAETGSLRFLWVSATNPAVSLPELHRIRSISDQDRLFLVVQDAFRTETAELADVVLPAAISRLRAADGLARQGTRWSRAARRRDPALGVLLVNPPAGYYVLGPGAGAVAAFRPCRHRRLFVRGR